MLQGIGLIGLTGYAGAGKSTAAQYLIRQHGYVLVKFAGPLKAMLRALGLGDREIEGDLKDAPCAALGGRTPRFAMQTLGTEWGRYIMGTDFWVNAAMEVAFDVIDQGGRVVLDDVRFPNEAAAVHKAGGLLINVFRPLVGPESGHISEHCSLPHDGVAMNTGDIRNLETEIDRLITEQWR